MNAWTNLRLFKTRNFIVALQCQPDNDADAYVSHDSATRAGIARGDYAPYVFRVVVYCNGTEIGADYLSDSIYSNPADFAREHYGLAPKARAAGVTYCVYFPALVQEAIREARMTIAAMPRVWGAQP